MKKKVIIGIIITIVILIIAIIASISREEKTIETMSKEKIAKTNFKNTEKIKEN